MDPRGTEQEIHTCLKISNEDRTNGEAGPVDTTDQQLRATSLSSGNCSLSEESGFVRALEEPIGKAVEKGVVPISEVPAVAGKEGEDENELHPLWQLLELAGYELL